MSWKFSHWVFSCKYLLGFQILLQYLPSPVMNRLSIHSPLETRGFPPCLEFYLFIVNVVFSPCVSMAASFLCTLHQQLPHFDASILSLFIFISPSSPFLPLRQSVYLFRPSGREKLWGSSSALFFLCQSSMKANPIDFEQDSALDWILYVISLLCLREEAFPPELAKIPALSQKVPLAEEHHRRGRTLGRTCDQTPSSADGRSLQFTFPHFSCRSLCLPAQEGDQSSPEVASSLFCCLLFFSWRLLCSTCWDGHTSRCVRDRVCTEGFYSPTLRRTEMVFKELVWWQTAACADTES